MGSGPHVQADMRRRVREFLSTRRARLTPEQAGLPSVGGRRRVKGLRREEVAALAGISVEYYIRLERGDAGNVSGSVLEAIGRALRLGAAEHDHLLDLLRPADGFECPVVDRPALRPPVQRILDSMGTTPALVHNWRLDVIGANALGTALLEPVRTGSEAVNLARAVFLGPAARDFWPDWEPVATETANRLRVAAGSKPCDRALADLVDELSTHSADFREHWARHEVRVPASGVRRLRHPVVGELVLPFESTPLVADPGQTLLMFTAEPGSASDDALKLLASWSAVARR
ncbi:helix-turn-helix transcriptional regulator [Kineosporia sp. NBRC 101677]|uniref:helix-turn-helix domain-containing protein n=1 Tax=Kineosporia sp. NBRC 101677 TaxID=3032197 RepID=UPI00255559F4|nr:helix-turn-helix transcriptional regulator [Kineosporia sp. NBRC 101677]